MLTRTQSCLRGWKVRSISSAHRLGLPRASDNAQEALPVTARTWHMTAFPPSTLFRLHLEKCFAFEGLPSTLIVTWFHLETDANSRGLNIPNDPSKPQDTENNIRSHPAGPITLHLIPFLLQFHNIQLLWWNPELNDSAHPKKWCLI